MKKIVGLIIILCCSLTAVAQLKISISEITLKNGGTERIEYDDDEPYNVGVINQYISIKADIYNDSSEAIDIQVHDLVKTFSIEYRHNGIKKIAACSILNVKMTEMRWILSIPPKSIFKLRIMAFPEELSSEEFSSNTIKSFPEFPDGWSLEDLIPNFIKIYPTITLKFVDKKLNKLVESSEPIKAKNCIVKSESAVATESDPNESIEPDSDESIEPDSDESTEPGTILYI